MWAAIIPVHTGYAWLNVVVYVVSGGAFVRICFLLPEWYRNVLKPQLSALGFGRYKDRQNK